MDEFDKRILACLQKDAKFAAGGNRRAGRPFFHSVLAAYTEFGKSGRYRWPRRSARPGQAECGVTVFVALKTSEHSQDWLETFAGHVNSIDEVVEFYRMSGDVDYMLRVVVPDIAAYDEVYKRLIAVGGLSDVSSSFAMERINHH